VDARDQRQPQRHRQQGLSRHRHRQQGHARHRRARLPRPPPRPAHRAQRPLRPAHRGNTHILNRPYVNILIDVNGDGTTDHEYQLSWIGAGKLKIVNELPGVTPAVDLGAGWHNKVFQVSDILAVYPDAKLARAFPADNGLPADLTMPPLWLVLGDSTYTRYSRVLLREVRLNS
jgi:hypothetical protein